MEAKELRVGNYVYDRDNKILRIDWWENINKVCMDVNILYEKAHPLTEYSENTKPIPLTAGWLARFGFRKIAMTYKYFSFTINKWSDDKLMYGYIGGNIEIKYVHQLQNLYYALTSEELTINE